MTPDIPHPGTPRDEGLAKLAQSGRLEFRLVRDGQALTDEIRAQIIGDIRAYRDDHGIGNQPLSWGRLAELIGIAQGTLVEVVRGVYRGDTDAILRKMDQFLGDDRAHTGRYDFRTTARIGVSEAIFGTIGSSIRNGTMAVIIGSPGTGKSVHARAFAADRGGVLLIRADEAHRDARGVSKLLAIATGGLRRVVHRSHSRRVLQLKDWLRKHRGTVIVIDEAQKLTRDGLEMLRDIHDISDPAARRNIPIVFFGDHGFKKLIFAGRTGERSPISPQTARRMRPVLDIDADCQVDDGGGIYTVEDVVKIVRNNRVKLLTADAVRWLRDLANVPGYGRLGFALGVLQLAIDMAIPPGGTLAHPLDVLDLQEALRCTFGRNVVLDIDEAAGGRLLLGAAG